MHEHLFIFRKPAQGENLTRIQFSAWKGVQKTQSAEEVEELRGLMNWEDTQAKK